VSQAFQYGWTKLQQNVGQIAIAIGIWFVAVIVFGLIGFFVTGAIADTALNCEQTVFGEVCTSDSSFWSVLLITGIWSFAWTVAIFAASYFIIRGALAITAGRPLNKDELFDMSNFVPFLITSIVVAIIVSIGSFLCFIPGLIAWFFLFFAQYYAADRGMGVGESLRASVTVMNQNLARMVGFFIASLVAYAIGALLCGIGLLVAVPVIIIASAYMYRTANGELVAP
jgi:uncharacterized membrane protein